MEPSLNDERRLDDFADTLRSAHQECAVSSSFEDNLFDALSETKPLRRVIQQSAFMRVAAALLIMCIIGVPAAALMGVLPLGDDKQITLSFIPAESLDESELQEMIGPLASTESVVIPPHDEYIGDRVYNQRVAVISAHNYWQRLLAPYPDSIEFAVLAGVDVVLASIVVK